MSVRGLTVLDLQGLANRASGSGAKLVFRDVGGLSVLDMQGIATRGAGNVTFVL